MRILVVDDEEDVREAICSFIEELFIIEIVQASSGAEAIKIIDQDESVGLIIADYNMPIESSTDVNGGGLYQHNLNKGNIPFFLFSIEKIEDHKELKNFFTDNPLNIAIGKPYDEEYTKNAIKNVIIHSQKEQS